MANPLIGTGFAQRIEGMTFDPAREYRACLLCGAVFQSALDRALYQDVNVRAQAKRLRDRWAKRHAKKHPQKEHTMLRTSGLTMTPEAAKKLVGYGLLPISDMAQFSDETINALAESNPVPADDAEG